ncbi:uncharacterized protein LOC120477253 [Pimephales promelas]|uniref:uncharacterized protein LOC120477253 n=1 Tax=Pimephales promelas TaxID=90988 RepID=UPI0019555366|nr:uncharacterized protein LOC120477253 [Pimephales promelas]KAG1928313.1 hypothetical protein F2P79_023717 [Pimephales promelas]
MWLKNLNLKTPPKQLFVCSFHLVDKKPTHDNPYPTLFLGYEKPPEKKRRRPRIRHGTTTTDEPDLMDVSGEPDPSSQTFHDAQTQWSDPAMEDHTYSKGPTITCVMTTAPSSKSSLSVADVVLKDDADCLLYTGIPLLEFRTLVSCLQHFAPTSSSLSAEDQILLTLMKLRQNFVIADLARRFKMSPGQVSKTLKFWIDAIAEHTQDLIPWLPRETIKSTLPQGFMDNFPNTTCVIDCTESVLQKAKNLDSRTESYSHYYANNTVKYLVATAPSGIIMYISEAYGGKCSDRFITQNSGFLDHLRPGDEVIGDRGFTIRDLLEERKVRLITPAFTRKKCQLTNEQVTRTRRIANVRIHIERAIRRLKVYRILSQTVPIHFVPKIDKILRICAALVNLRGELISRT